MTPLSNPMISVYWPRKSLGNFPNLLSNQWRACFSCVCVHIFCIFNVLRKTNSLLPLGSAGAGEDKWSLELITTPEHSINDQQPRGHLLWWSTIRAAPFIELHPQQHLINMRAAVKIAGWLSIPFISWHWPRFSSPRLRRWGQSRWREMGNAHCLKMEMAFKQVIVVPCTSAAAAEHLA